MKIQKDKKKEKKVQVEEKKREPKADSKCTEQQILDDFKKMDPTEQKKWKFAFFEHKINTEFPMLGFLCGFTIIFSIVWIAFWSVVLEENLRVHYFKTSVIVLTIIFQLVKIYIFGRTYWSKRNLNDEGIVQAIQNVKFVLMISALGLAFDVAGIYNSRFHFHKALYRAIFEFGWSFTGLPLPKFTEDASAIPPQQVEMLNEILEPSEKSTMFQAAIIGVYAFIYFQTKQIHGLLVARKKLLNEIPASSHPK